MSDLSVLYSGQPGCVDPINLTEGQLVIRVDDLELSYAALLKKEARALDDCVKKDATIKQHLAELQALGKTHLIQTKLTERAVLESVRAAQNDIIQKQRLKDMEEKIGCLEGRAKELECHNAIWAEKFVMEVLEGRKSLQEKEVQLADARRIALDCEMELAAAIIAKADQERREERLKEMVGYLEEKSKGREEDVYFLEMHTICDKEHIRNLKADVGEKKVQIDLLQGGLTKRDQEVRALKVELQAKEVEIKGFIKAERVTRQDVERFERKDEGRKIEEALGSKRRGEAIRTGGKRPRSVAGAIPLSTIDVNMVVADSEPEEILETLYDN
ncbi:hypothetical protein QFC21_002598 [Naganishia friedmannii]|uniref:Uncharacterized protein n=1 Tax=Naganishia friedmannii TaxID=89922 RepID=A0ACC2VVM9_9TREE|nr:hypothetical protein QFC21_002598 [Naganishia friedmannii]